MDFVKCFRSQIHRHPCHYGCRISLGQALLFVLALSLFVFGTGATAFDCPTPVPSLTFTNRFQAGSFLLTRRRGRDIATSTRMLSPKATFVSWSTDWKPEQYGDGVKGLVFDCDGTLVNSMPMWAENWRRTCSDFGIAFSEQRFYELAGKTLDETLRVLSSEQGVEVDSKEFFLRKDAIVEEIIDYVEEITPVCDIARRHAGSLPLAVVSSGPRSMVLRLLEQCGLASLFSVVICAEDVSQHKPHPEPFLAAARRLDIPPHHLRAFEDADAGCESAEAAGMHVIDVRRIVGYPVR